MKKKVLLGSVAFIAMTAGASSLAKAKSASELCSGQPPSSEIVVPVALPDGTRGSAHIECGSTAGEVAGIELLGDSEDDGQSGHGRDRGGDQEGSGHGRGHGGGTDELDDSGHGRGHGESSGHGRGGDNDVDDEDDDADDEDEDETEADEADEADDD